MSMKPCYCLGLATINKVAKEGQFSTTFVDFVAADDIFKKVVSVDGQDVELAAKVLEAAQLHNDTDEGGTVFMPDEEEWGEIVGIARKLAQL